MKKILKTLLEIIEGTLILVWVLYSPIWTCMIAYNAACYVNYGEVATPYVVIVIATILFIVNIVWLNHVIDKVEKGGKRNG
ncbi:hypothetical protein [Segatella bryantii]|uniref:hypothetical protein n=1 Tax=Segatella bryantii TaxID=77095 RepID=UPI002431AE43|nr:hypothetical protein [Segatella bryantii]